MKRWGRRSFFVVCQYEADHERTMVCPTRLAVAIVAVATAGAQPVHRTAPPAIIHEIQDRIAQSDLDGARARLDSAVRAYPNDGGLYNLAGIVAAKEDQYGPAETAFRKAVRLSPRLSAAWLNLGRLYQTYIDRDPAAAEKGIAVYRRLLAAQPNLPEANYQIALLLEHRGAFREAIAHLGRLPPEDRTRTGAVVLLCLAQAGIGDAGAAAETARLLAGRSDLLDADVAGMLPALEKAKAGEAARALLEGLAQRNLASQQSLARLAAIYEEAGDLGPARATFERVAQGAPNTTKPLLDLARVAWKQKDYEATLGYLGHARDLEPRSAAIHFAFGVTCNEMRLLAEARKSLETALSLAPDNPYYNYAMGAIQMQWADASRSVPFLRKYVAARPEDPRGHLALATAQFLSGDYDQAKLEVQPFAAEASIRAGAEFLLGRIARETGDLEEAARRLETALRLSPDSPDVHAELGFVLFQKEDLDGAERETNLALKQDPDNYTANRTLMQILFRRKDTRRAEAQAERLKSLVEDRNRKAQSMLRSIEVRPY